MSLWDNDSNMVRRWQVISNNDPKSDSSTDIVSYLSDVSSYSLGLHHKFDESIGML